MRPILKLSLIGGGATLTIYGMNDDIGRLDKEKIHFQEHISAKYIYDSFWNQEQINESTKLNPKVSI